MPLTEIQTRDALRAANDWLVVSDPPGAASALEGIADVIPLVMMGEVVARDLDELASIVEERGQSEDAKAAVRAAFEHVKSAQGA